MSNINDFVIENGVLIKYQGPGGDVVIPDGVTRIDDMAFTGCTSLTSVVIPEGVTSIGWTAFWRCSSLASVVIPKGVTSIGGMAFSDCTSLTSVVIPDSVRSIGDSAFSCCTSITSVVIPDSVTSIGDSAFYGCFSLAGVVIPESVTEIGDRAFFRCEKLADENGFVIIRNVLYSYQGSKTDVVIPDGVKSISSCAFSEILIFIGGSDVSRRTNLTSVVIPESVTSIGDEAFSHCKSLTGVVIPESVTSIGDEAFSYCKSLTGVVIPEGVKIIGKKAFAECDELCTIIAPSMPLQYFIDEKLDVQAACGFLSAREFYTDPDECEKYKKICMSKRKKLLAFIFKLDDAKALSFYIDEKKVTAKNFDTDYFVPALQVGAEKCKALLLEWKEQH